MYILRYFLVIIVSLTLHEVGHYLAALAFRVRVSKFCLFLDPGFRLLDTGTRFKTRFCIGWLPLGAYVRFHSDHSDDEDTLEDDLSKIHPMKRIIVYLGGVLMNLLVAVACSFLWSHNHNAEKPLTVQAERSAIVLRAEKDNTLGVIYDYFGMTEKAQQPEYNYGSFDNYRLYVQSKKAEERGTRIGSADFNFFLRSLVMFNLMMIFFNLLPIPPLDGSKILYNIYEWVMHKPVNYWFQIIAATVGITLLVGYDLISTLIKTLKDYM